MYYLQIEARLAQLQETCAFSQCFRKFREYLTLQSEKGGGAL